MNGKLTATLSARGRLKATLSKAIERIEPIIKPLEITENGNYSAPETVHGFNPVKVNVPIRYEEGYAEGFQASQDGLQEKDITANGEYTADEGHTGFKKVNVNVSLDNIGKPFIDTSKITDFQHFCRANRLNYCLEQLDTSKGTDFSNMFNSCSALATIPLLDTSNGTTFSEMFNSCSTLITIPLLDTSKGTDFSNMFKYCHSLTTIPLLDTSKGTDFSNMFNTCRALATIPLLDTSNGTNFQQMFRSCNGLITIPQLDISAVTNTSYFNNMFYSCSKLETVSFTTAKSNLSTNTFQGCTALKNITIGEGWAVNIYLHYSNELTVESLHGMIENLADLTGQTAKTFQIGATNLAKIDEEHINMLKAKNWNYS